MVDLLSHTRKKIAWLLTTYSFEATVSSKQREIALISRHPGEAVEAFAIEIQFKGSLLGDLINEGH
jgi:hypothetical protein